MTMRKRLLGHSCACTGAIAGAATAAKQAVVGRELGALRWGQPRYVTEERGRGRTVRIERLKAGGGYAIYFHCQSGLVGQFRELYPDTFTYEGKRAMHFAAKDRL